MERSTLLLRRELHRLTQSRPWGISAAPKEQAGSYLQWEATVEAPPGSLWKGGRFRLVLDFPPFYDEGPPRVYFLTVPFHPNVHATSGQPCLACLDGKEAWRQGTTVEYVLVGIQVDRPYLHDGVSTPLNLWYSLVAFHLNDTLEHRHITTRIYLLILTHSMKLILKEQQ